MTERSLTVFPARKIITVERALPEATAVAVSDGRIVTVGTLDDLEPWLARIDHSIDRSFEDKVLVPGLIDPHMHPLLPAVLTQMPFVAPDPWSLPTGSFPGATTPRDFLAQVKRLFARHDPNPSDAGGSGRPFFVFGYQPHFHGELSRGVLDDEISATLPVVLWHRSFHAITANSPALDWLGVTEIGQVDEAIRHQVDIGAGHFFEGGLSAVFGRIGGYFFEPSRLSRGFANLIEMVHAGGITTIADMGTGLFMDTATEAARIHQALGEDSVPFRTMLTPICTAFAGSTPEDALAICDSLHETNTEKVFFDRHFKLMADGAFFSQTFQLSEPGYIDGHEGEWVQPTETTDLFADVFWRAGYQIHIHCNGDRGARYSIDLLKRLLNAHPRVDHRFTMEHWGYSTEDQNRQLATLGAVVSGQPNYIYVLGDKYAAFGLGTDRAHQMCRFGSLVALGVPLALHSDCAMAPLEPLRLAWIAANRRTIAGTELAPAERLNLDQALRAVTIGAAWILGLEDEVGSIRAGKKADFTVLEKDPYEVGVEGLADIPVWGTVFEGRPAPSIREPD